MIVVGKHHFSPEKKEKKYIVQCHEFHTCCGCFTVYLAKAMIMENEFCTPSKQGKKIFDV